jgi:hypothetical protein
MKAFVAVNALSRVTPCRPLLVRAEDSYYWAHQARGPNRLFQIFSATVLVGAIILAAAMLRV